MIITIGFSSAKSDWMLFARAIEAVEKRPFSHVYVKYSEEGQDSVVFHATGAGVHKNYYSDFLKHNTVIKEYHLDFNELESEEFYDLMEELLNRSYSWLDIVGIFWRKMTHLKNPFKDGLTTVICSELGAKVCKIKKIAIPEPLDDITPSDLDKVLEEYKRSV